MDFSFVHILGPFLGDVGSLDIDGISWFWDSQLFDCFMLHEEDPSSHIAIVYTL